MHLRQQIKSVYFFLIVWLFLPLLAYTQQNINDIKVTVTFDATPTTFTVTKAPLKYNKQFAFSFQVDDGVVDLYDKVLPIFNNLFYTDGCGNDIPFTASSSLYIFQTPGENGPDMHDPLDPSFDNSYLTWDFIKQLYNLNYGIYNHGVNGNPSIINNWMNYSIKRNRSFVRRKMFSTASGADVSKVFVCPNQIYEWTQPAFDNNYDLVLNNRDGGPIGLSGGDVNNGAFSWTNHQFVKRSEAHRDKNVLDYISALYNQSIDGANYWGSLFTHGVPDVDNGDDYPKNIFDSDFASIASFYGKGGMDNILVASAEEIYDYLNVRDAVTVEENLNGNTLELTFSGSVPDDLRFYAMSLILEGDAGISNISVTGANNFSVNESSGIINFSWDDRNIEDPVVLAQNFTTIAESSEDKWDAWVAMDYVYTLPLDETKIELATRLCNIPGVTYEEGFCDMTIDTIVKISGDTIICMGESTILTATSGMDYYEWSTGQSTPTIEVSPTETTQYWVKGTLKNNQTQDYTTVVVNPVPNIISHSLANINHIPGTKDTLWVSTQDEALTYLWDNGSTDSTLIVDPPFSADYYVDVFNTYECSTRQEFSVKVNNTFDFSFDSVCFGGITHLENISSYPDSVIRVLWDLNSDGVFDDAEGDIVEYEFLEAGNHLVGMKSVLYPTGIELTFHVVSVGDNPMPDFEVSNVCIPSSTNFNDISTVIVGELVDWSWDFGDGGTDVNGYVSHTYSVPDQYNVKLVVSSNIGCKDSITKQIDIGESTDFVMIDVEGNTLFPNDTSWITKGDSLYVTIENATLYDSIIWNNEIRNAVYYVINEGAFSVDVYSGPCVLSRERILAFSGGGGGEPTTNEVMSLFTPNGDGYNDNWVVNDPNITAPFKVSVYNRYGNLVYESPDYQNDWQGTYNNTSLPQATYYYIIEDALGVIFKGPVTILR